MKMRSKLFAFLVFAIIASACSSSASVPEETTQVEAQSATEPAEEKIKESKETETTLTEGEIEDEANEPAEEPKPQFYTPQLEDKIVMSLNQWLEANGAPGSAVSVLLPDGSQVNVAAGSRDRNGTPASVDDYWRIASISKPITSAIVLKLVQEGKIEIDEPVMTYLGDEWAQGYVLDGIDYAPLITIRQILDHTDGFHEYAFDPGFYLLASSRLDVPFDPQEVVDWGFERGPLFIPGTEYSYNTVGHVIAGLVIESVTGKQAHELLRIYNDPCKRPRHVLASQRIPP